MWGSVLGMAKVCVGMDDIGRYVVKAFPPSLLSAQPFGLQRLRLTPGTHPRTRRARARAAPLVARGHGGLLPGARRHRRGARCAGYVLLSLPTAFPLLLLSSPHIHPTARSHPGPENYVKAATHFYRALRVYPQPVELLMIYQKVCPEPVFQLVLKLTQLTSAANAGGAAAVARTAAGGATAEEVDDVDEAAPAAPAAPTSEDVGPKGESADDDDEDKEDAASHPSSGASWEKVNDDN